jgi:hypothetical protein
MTTQQIIIVISVVLIVVIALGAARGSGGPRITQITRTRRKDNDEPKGGDDA